jgi:hypothetical protein
LRTSILEPAAAPEEVSGRATARGRDAAAAAVRFAAAAASLRSMKLRAGSAAASAAALLTTLRVMKSPAGASLLDEALPTGASAWPDRLLKKSPIAAVLQELLFAD